MQIATALHEVSRKLDEPFFSYIDFIPSSASLLSNIAFASPLFFVFNVFLQLFYMKSFLCLIPPLSCNIHCVFSLMTHSFHISFICTFSCHSSVCPEDSYSFLHVW